MVEAVSRYLAWASLLFGLVSSCAAMVLVFDHNEHMYVTAGVLTSKGLSVYRDFAFVQSPYLPLVYGALYSVLPTSHYLLTAKLVSLFFLLSSTAMVLLLARRLLADRVLPVAFAGLFLLNPTIRRASTEASNYAMPMAFSLLACYLLLTPALTLPSAVKVVLAGVCLGIATGTKLYYAALLIPFLVFTLRSAAGPSRWTRISRTAIFFALGVLIGIIPMLYYLARDPAVFWYNNLGVFESTLLWRERLQGKFPLTLGGNVAFARRIWLEADNALLLTIAMTALVTLAPKRSPEEAEEDRTGSTRRALTLILPTFVMAALITMLPIPAFPQYHAMPASLLVVLCVVCVGLLAAQGTSLRPLVVPVLLLTLVSSFPSSARDILRARSLENWSGISMHRVGERMREAVGGATRGKIATVSPLYPLEGDLPIYREFATGPFMYRVGDLVAPFLRARVVSTSPTTLSTLLDGDPPAAIFVGFEGSVDDAFRHYAETRGYQKAPGNWRGGELYVRR
jgi:hypothetical protein